MRKIIYPLAKDELKRFHDAYLNIFGNELKEKINEKLEKLPKFNSNTLTFERLVLANFEELMCLKNVLSGRDELFDYDSLSKKIHNFFNSRFDFKICFYCGIDHIYAFTDRNDYVDNYDFLNNASKEELKLIKDVGDVTADKIIGYRKNQTICKEEDLINLGINKDVKLNHTYDHYTLDHILPKKDYRYFSYSLYNLVPCCAGCNSKFKRIHNFEVNNDLSYIVPSSFLYNLDNDFKFKLFYINDFKEIRTVSDFKLGSRIFGNDKQVDDYIRTFKIKGRYNIHKDILLEMIRRESDYSKEKIMEIARLMRKPEQEIKELIFGKEIFHKTLDAPLHKLKRDIAENLKIV